MIRGMVILLWVAFYWHFNQNMWSMLFFFLLPLIYLVSEICACLWWDPVDRSIPSVVVGERWWFLYSSAFSKWFYFDSFGLIARWVLDTCISFGGNVWLCSRQLFLSIWFVANVPARVCKAAVAYWNPAALVLKQRGLYSHSVSVLGLLCLFFRVENLSLSVLTLSRNLSLHASCCRM